jgi:hypothetical protein
MIGDFVCLVIGGCIIAVPLIVAAYFADKEALRDGIDLSSDD